MTYIHINKKGEKYYLHKGKNNGIYFFKRKIKKGCTVDEVPSNLEVIENPVTGMPLLRGR